MRAYSFIAIVFVIHSGGYIFGGTTATNDRATALVSKQVAQFRRHGIEALAVPYQRGNPGRATRQVERFVRTHARGRRAYAMGFSAGGGLAQSLANAGLVRAAAEQAPLSDLRAWAPGRGFGWSPTSLTAASPVLGHSVVPQFVEHARDDSIVPYVQSVRWAHQRPHVQLVLTRTGNHSTGLVGGRWPRGFRWLVRQIRTRSSRPTAAGS